MTSSLREQEGSCAPPPNGIIRGILRELTPVLDAHVLLRTSGSLKSISLPLSWKWGPQLYSGMTEEGERGYSTSHLAKKSASPLLFVPSLSSALHALWFQWSQHESCTQLQLLLSSFKSPVGMILLFYLPEIREHLWSHWCSLFLFEVLPVISMFYFLFSFFFFF